VARLFNLLIFLLIANLLGAESLGQFVFAMTLAQTVGMLVDFGMNPILVREAVRDGGWALFKTFATLKLGLALVAGSTAFVLGWVIFGYRDNAALSVALALGAIISLSYLSLLFSLIRARQEMIYEALFTLGHRSAYLLLALPLLLIVGHVKGVLAAYALSGLLTVVALYAFVRRRYAESGQEAIPIDRSLLGQVIPLVTIDVFTWIYLRIDALMLQTLKGYVEVGIYGAAHRLFEGLIVVPSVLAIAFFPRLVQDLANKDKSKQMRLYVLAFLCLGAVTATALWPLSEPLLGLLYRRQDDFAASVRVFQILLITFGVLCINYPLTQIAIAAGRQKRYAWAVIGASAVNIGLNALVIPRYGARGAAAVTVATELSLTLFMHHELGRVWARFKAPRKTPDSSPVSDHVS
jgi:O-antigen/teichoic acid export membrane protein